MSAPCLLQQAEIRRAQQLLNRLSRVAAAINLRTSDPLTESGRDPLAELRHYYGTVASDVTLDWTVSGTSQPCSGRHLDWAGFYRDVSFAVNAKQGLAGGWVPLGVLCAGRNQCVWHSKQNGSSGAGQIEAYVWICVSPCRRLCPASLAPLLRPWV